MDKAMKTYARTCGVMKDPLITLGVHFGSVLSSFLFATVINVKTWPIQDEILWCM